MKDLLIFLIKDLRIWICVALVVLMVIQLVESLK